MPRKPVTPRDLERIEAEAEQMAHLAEGPMREDPEPRRKQFAYALHRHARGARAAAAAWRQDLTHTT